MTTSTRPPRQLATNQFVGSTVAVGDLAGSLNGELVGLAVAELERGHLEQAEHYLRQGLARNPANPHCRAFLEVCRAGSGVDCRAAERSIREIVSDHPHDPVVFFALGQVLLHDSRRKEAFRMFSRAHRLAADQRDLQRRIQRTDSRRPPVFPGLDRDHPLNVTCGKLRAAFARLRSR